MEQTIETLPEKIFFTILQMQHENCLYLLEKGGEKGRKGLTPKRLNELALKLAIHFNQAYHDETKVLISMEFGVEFVVTILACIYARKTFIPVLVPKVKSEIQRIHEIQNDCGVSIALVTKRSQYFFESENLSEAFPKLMNIDLDLINSISVNLQNIEKSFYELQENIPNINNDFLAVIQYTSGSTGSPKGVKITDQNILYNHIQVAKRWKFNKSQSFLTWLPVYHDMGLFGIIYRLFLSGMQLYILPTNDFIKKPIRWLKAMSDYKIDNSGGPPFSYDMCLKAVEMESSLELDLSNWKIAFCGADYVSHELLENFRDMGETYGLDRDAVFATYGMAESTLFVAGEPFLETKSIQEKVSSKTLSEGCYFPEKSPENLLIYDRESETVASEGQEGEILISGESVSSAYLSVKMDFLEINGKKWMKTGDLGFIEKNTLFISGRSKDIIKIYGRGLSVNDIVVSLSRQIKELNSRAADIFTKDQFSNSLVAVLELNAKLSNYDKNYLDLLEKNVRIILFEEYGIHIEEVLLLSRGSLPKTSSGKVQRNSIEALYKESRFL